jgi:hypothetical protein
MRYLTIYRSTAHEEGAPPSPEHMAEMGRLIEEMTAAGVLISTEPLTPRAQCARITLKDGAFTVEDEAERASGFALLQFGSKEEAIEGCKRFLSVAGDGVVEMRQILEFAAQPEPA